MALFNWGFIQQVGFSQAELPAIPYPGMINLKPNAARAMELARSGKPALITGVSRGGGAAVSAELSRKDINVCPVGFDRARLNEVAAGIADASLIGHVMHAAERRGADAIAAAAASAAAAFGRACVLVSTAGAIRRPDFFTFPEEDW
jgi:NAD(P)-dependent dehydrogenase (short-subunit alcohol dehydrogenase family)